MTVHLQREIENLKKQVMEQAARVEENLTKAIQSIELTDVVQARAVIEADGQIDHFEVQIEEECLKLLALYQPVAGDLRLIITVLKVNNDLERVGDLAVNIAERTFELAADQGPVPVIDLSAMAARARSMLRKSLDALVQGDTELARAVCQEDDVVDLMNREMYQLLKRAIHSEPERLDTWLHYLSVSRFLERVADHATNLAEDVIYLVEGNIVRHCVR